MCGICGYVSKKGITVEKLKEINDTMYHRGPDDSGAEIYPMIERSMNRNNIGCR